MSQTFVQKQSSVSLLRNVEADNMNIEDVVIKHIKK